MTHVYSVPGISCEHCRNAIEHEVATVIGVVGVVVDVDAKTVRVDGEADERSVRSAIADAGYDIEEAQ